LVLPAPRLDCIRRSFFRLPASRLGPLAADICSDLRSRIGLRLSGLSVFRMSCFPGNFRLSRTSGVSKLPALSGASVLSGHSQPSNCSSFLCSSEFPVPHGIPTVDLLALPGISESSIHRPSSRSTIGPSGRHRPSGRSTIGPSGRHRPLVSIGLSASINLPVGTSSALPAGIDLPVG
jgi:hypothetical protein